MKLDLSKIAILVGRVLAPITIITAVLFYYGWQRTRSIYTHFGIHYTFLDFTNQEFMLRSLDIVLTAFRVLPLVLIGLLIVHFYYDRQLKKGHQNVSRSHLIAILLIAIGILLYILSVTGWIALRSRALAWLLFTMGVIVIAYGLFRIAQLSYMRRVSLAKAPVPDGDPTSKWYRGLEFIASHLIMDEEGKSRWTGLILIAAIVVLGAFYSAAFYAYERAEEVVDEFERTNLVEFPNVTIYSNTPLFLDSSSVTFQDLGGSEGYRFRYDGLKLLMRVSDKYFLIPSNWSRSENNETIVLPDSDAIELKLIPVKITDSKDRLPN